MLNNNKNLKNIMDELSKNATHIVSNPDTIKKMQLMGLPIKQNFTSYKEYFENLVNQKRKDAVNLLNQLPLLDNSIANGVISEIYEEVRSSFGLSIFTSTIFNSVVLLEYSMRIRLFNERLKNDPNYKWESTEKLTMKSLIKYLYKLKVIDDIGKGQLDSFNEKFRNPYFHINIHNMIQGIYANHVKKVDINKNKISEINGMDVSKSPQLWFLAKKYYDKSYVMQVLIFCIGWTNDLLKRPKVEI